ncbi:MAG: redoxin domain-containing protein [Gammaproteobacteria bacterium]|nr:redoxin domain-containing protein [Gammaproteobacteria bacterium]
MMLKPTLFALFALLSCSAAAESAPVGDFALLDHNGKFHQLRYYGDHKALVLVVQGNGGAAVQSAATRLNALRAEFEGQGVIFFMLNPVASDSRQSIAEEAKAFAYDVPVLVDQTQLVAESLQVERIGEVLIIDPQRMTLVARGSIEAAGSAHLEDALQNILSDKPVTSDGPAATGSRVTYAIRERHREKQVSYTQDIVPILKDNCVACHHDGGIGPWSMSSHAMLRGWSAMMREVVMNRRMPPGQIDLHLSKEIEPVAGLSPYEMQQLIHWIDAGAPIDGEVDPLTALTFVNPRFSLGEPDMVFKVAAQSIPATGVIDYRYVPVKLNLDRDVWVRAMEFVPGDRAVLHHVIAYVSSPADKTVRGRQTGAARGESVGGFAPGRQPDSFRDNSGRLIRKGSNLLLQMHYTTSGKATVDETEVGIFLHDKPPTYVMSGGVAGQRRFLVPPHEKEYKLEGEQLIERDAYLYQMTPHMHFRGKYMSYTAEYPDGSSELLLSVPKYDFNWQFSYPLKEPVFLPAGSRLVARGAMDNSDRNAGNPDPSKPVHFGLQTMHEMFFGFTTLRYVGETPESVLSSNPSDEVAELSAGPRSGEPGE